MSQSRSPAASPKPVLRIHPDGHHFEQEIVPRASCEADRREITCGLTNFVLRGRFSWPPGTERRHYLASTDYAAVASFGTVRTSSMSDRLPEIRS
jgi:hypothetical protein